MTLANIILVLTAVTTALTAGLFYAWSCSVMPGFTRLNDREFVSVMQKANRAIQNPVFFAAFFGAPVFLIFSTIYFYYQTPRFFLILAAAVIYLAGTFAVTVFGNVPMNDALDRFNLDSATADEIARARADFERRWNNLNNIRTVSSTLALVFVVIAYLN
jgi:uncharacterized membrane protein